MRKPLLSVIVLSSALFAACGSNNESSEEKPKNQLEAFQEFSNKAQKMAEDLENKEPVEPVDFRMLKDLLPANASGLPLKESSGEKNGTMGFTLSTAEANYQSEDGQSTIDISLTDAGGVSGFAMIGLAAWTMAEVDKETSTGYEKTISIDGHKAFEKYDNSDQSGEIAVLVADRFIVKVDGYQVSMDQIKKTLNEIDLKALANVK